MVGTDRLLKELVPDPFPADTTNPINTMAGYVRLAILKAALEPDSRQVEFDQMTLDMVDSMAQDYDLLSLLVNAQETTAAKEAASKSMKHRHQYQQVGAVLLDLVELYRPPDPRPRMPKRRTAPGNNPFKAPADSGPSLSHQRGSDSFSLKSLR